MSEPIDRLRRIAAACAGSRALEDGDAQWLAEALADYFTNAPAGRTLDATLGLAVGPGELPWWRVEDRQRRDAALRALASSFLADLNLARQAEEIAKLARQYQTTSWRFDRDRPEPPLSYRGTHREHLFQALRHGEVPGKRRLQDILAARK